MKSLFTDDAYIEILDRLDVLTENSKRKWGKMAPAQMLCHCQFPLNIALNRYQMQKPSFFKRLLFRSFKPSLYNDKLWKENLPTPPAFRIGEDKDFFEEKTKLKQCIVDFHGEKN